MTKKSIFLEYITPTDQEKHKLKATLYLEPHDYQINYAIIDLLYQSGISVIDV